MTGQLVTSVLLEGLGRIGYQGQLLETNYSFRDWFSRQEVRTVPAAAFARTPVSYETACIGVAVANGVRGVELVNQLRALGAPLILEVDGDEVREWLVSRIENQHTLVDRYPAADVHSVVVDRAEDWAPESLLRAKNIGSYRWAEQRSLLSGLVPELERQIQEKLDPLLRDTLSRTRQAYTDSTAGRAPDPRELFKLVFWMLTAKVFRDRRMQGFTALSGDEEAILSSVAKHYGTGAPRLLNREARRAAAAIVWRDLDFRNLSVEVLAHIWSRTLVDRDTRRRLGIHRTPRAIVRYIVERIPFSQLGGREGQLILEPCSGSAAFLIGALNHLRPNLLLTSAQERHRYFVKHLSGIELDPFGVEISTLALTLADFPNRNGWDIREGDVFDSNAMAAVLPRAGVVLCNPPFESFTEEQRIRYGAEEVRKPAELLRRVLAGLPPNGVLGFVMPYIAVDGRPYANSRRALAERFATLEWTVLPERSFEDADTDIAVLIAKDPIPHHSAKVTFRRVEDREDAWERFKVEQVVSSDYTESFTSDRAKEGFVLPDMPEVWRFLADCTKLGEVADIHRGIEWRGQITPGRHVRSAPAPGYARGVGPNSKFYAFEVPAMTYLNVQEHEQRRRSWEKYEWFKPKAIVPKARVSRGRWRIVAFPDREGVACYHAFYGIWPKIASYDEVVLSAILNSPVANAFVATREGNRDVTAEVLRSIPMPSFSPADRKRLHSLVQEYQEAIARLEVPDGKPEKLLLAIDATVVDGYHMPARLERELLDYFNGNSRRVAHPFHDYFPANFDLYVPLSQYLDPRFATSTTGALVRKLAGR